MTLNGRFATTNNLARFSYTPDTNIFHMYRAIRTGRNSHPGPNGIPAIAYKFCPCAPSLSWKWTLS